MHLSSTLLITALAAVCQIQVVSARAWEWCANDYYCDHGAAFEGAWGCHDQPDCASKSAPTFNGESSSNTFCGYGVYPRSCWVWTEN